MPIYKGRWTARVEQDFKIEAGSLSEAEEELLEYECLPRYVVELHDITIESIKEATD